MKVPFPSFRCTTLHIRLTGGSVGGEIDCGLKMAQTLLTLRRFRLYSLAVLLGVTIGFAFFVVTSNGLQTARGGRIGGDFPAFYGAGKLVRSGQVDSLYDASAQRRAQDGLLPGVEDGWIHFAYPPYVAAAYVPFTFLSFKGAYIVHVTRDPFKRANLYIVRSDLDEADALRHSAF